MSAGMTNAQVALQAVATRYATSGLNRAMLLAEAQAYLTWLDEQDAARPPWPVRLASPEVAARYADVGGDDDEEIGPQDRGLPR